MREAQQVLESSTCISYVPLRRAQISIPVWQRTPWTGPRRYSSRLTNRPACYRSPSERGGAHSHASDAPRQDRRYNSMPSPKTLEASKPDCVSPVPLGNVPHGTTPYQISPSQFRRARFFNRPVSRIESYPEATSSCQTDRKTDRPTNGAIP